MFLERTVNSTIIIITGDFFPTAGRGEGAEGEHRELGGSFSSSELKGAEVPLACVTVRERREREGERGSRRGTLPRPGGGSQGREGGGLLERTPASVCAVCVLSAGRLLVHGEDGRRPRTFSLQPRQART